MTDYLTVKIPNNIVTVFLPPITTTQQTNFTYDERITEDGETRITEDGETRILDGWDINSYPELTVIKIPNGVISVEVKP